MGYRFAKEDDAALILGFIKDEWTTYRFSEDGITSLSESE